MAKMCKHVPLYGVKTWFVTTLPEALELVDELSGGEDDGTMLLHTKGVCYIVCEPDGHENRMYCVFDGTRDTAIHEAVHMAWMTLHYVNVKVTYMHDEPLAYLTAWMADEMLTFMGHK